MKEFTITATDPNWSISNATTWRFLQKRRLKAVVEHSASLDCWCHPRIQWIGGHDWLLVHWITEKEWQRAAFQNPLPVRR